MTKEGRKPKPERRSQKVAALRHSSFLRSRDGGGNTGSNILQLTSGIRPRFAYTMRYSRGGGRWRFAGGGVDPRRNKPGGSPDVRAAEGGSRAAAPATTKWFSGNSGEYTHG